MNVLRDLAERTETFAVKVQSQASLVAEADEGDGQDFVEVSMRWDEE